MKVSYRIFANEVADSLSNAAKGMDRELLKGANQVGNIVARAARANAPYKTGNLRVSIDYEVKPAGGLASATIYAATPYAMAVERGSKPHMIFARPGTGKRALLVFEIGGRKIFTPRVKHPGNKPVYFLKRALDENNGLISQILRDAAMKAFGL